MAPSKDLTRVRFHGDPILHLSKQLPFRCSGTDRVSFLLKVSPDNAILRRRLLQ